MTCLGLAHNSFGHSERGVRKIEILGTTLLVVIVSALSSLITGKIIAVYFFKIIDNFAEQMLEMIMDLVSYWVKGSGKQK